MIADASATTSASLTGPLGATLIDQFLDRIASFFPMARDNRLRLLDRPSRCGETQFAFAEGVGRFVLENPVAFQHQIDPSNGKPTKKSYDPRKWLRLGEKAMVTRLQEAFVDLGSKGKSLAG